MAFKSYKESAVYYENSKSELSQNLMPENSQARKNKYSVYGNILYMVGDHFNKLSQSLEMNKVNKSISRFDLNSMDVLYFADSVAGLSGVSATPFEKIEDWYYSEYPDILETVDSNPTISLLDNTTISPVKTINQVFSNPINFYITIGGDDLTFIHNKYNESQYGIYVKVIGKDQFSNHTEEEFYFTYPSYSKSRHLWSEVYDIKINSFVGYENFAISAKSHPDYNLITNIEDPSLFSYNSNLDLKDNFWSFENTLLIRKEFAAETLSDYYAGITGYNEINHYKLFAFNTLDQFEALNAVDHFYPARQDLIYVLKDDYLLAYNKRNPYSTLGKKAQVLRSEDPVVEIESTILAGKVSFYGLYNRIRVNKKIKAYRFIIELADGTIKYADNVSNNNAVNNTWEVFDSIEKGWHQYTMPNTYGFYSPEVEYSFGEYIDQDAILRIDLLLTNGNTDTSTIVVESQTKKPIWQLPVPAGALYVTENEHGIINIHYAGEVISVKKRDYTYIHDTENNIYLFKYNHGGSLKPMNIFNDLDALAMYHNLERKNGEDNIDFIKRLKFAANKLPSSSHSGLINGVNAELSASILSPIKISHGSYFRVHIQDGILTCEVGENLYSQNLYELNTVSELTSYLQSIGLTVSVIDSSCNTKMPKLIGNIDSRIIFPASYASGEKQYTVNLPEKGIISSVSIEGYQQVESIVEGKKQFTVNGNIIRTGRPLDGSEIRIEAYLSEVILKLYPVSATNLFYYAYENFSYGSISNFAQSILSAAENKISFRWGN